jgi:hypothetical protein
MKRVLLFLMFLQMPALIFAQSNRCSDSEAKMALSAGDKSKNHQEAFLQYNYAEDVACALELKIQAKGRKQKLFEKIEGLRLDAEKAKKEALIAAYIADSLAKNAEIEKQIAQDNLRLYTQMRDSANQARHDKQRSDAIAESKELFRSGENHLQNKNYQIAIDSFNKGMEVLDSLKFTDPTIQKEVDRLLGKIAEAKDLQRHLEEYKCYIDAGDSLARKTATVPEAFRAYLEAWRLGLDSQAVLGKLADMEATFVGGRYSSSMPKGIRYYEACSRSAETNLLLNRPEIAQKRIWHLLRNCRPIRHDFIKNTRLREFVNEYNQKTIHRMEFEIGVSHYFTSGLNFFYSSACIGTQIAFGDYSAIGFGLEFQFAKDRQLATATKLSQLGGRLYYAHTLFTVKNNSWEQNWLRVQGLVGVSSGYSQLTFPFRLLTDVNIKDVSGLTGGEVLGFPVQFERQDLTYQYVYNSNDKLIRFNYQIPGASFYTNILAGISIRSTPFVRHQEFGFFMNLSYQYQIQPLV